MPSQVAPRLRVPPSPPALSGMSGWRTVRWRLQERTSAPRWPAQLARLGSVGNPVLAPLSVVRPLQPLLAAVVAYRSGAARSTRQRLRPRAGPEIPRATDAD